MKRRIFLGNLGVGMLAGASVFAAQRDESAPSGLLKPGEIQHMVIFDLKHGKNSAEARKFLGDGKRILSAIPVVKQFQVFTQVSPKNDYDYGFSMVFADQAEYEEYNNHPDHVAFVEERWKKEVSRFLEIDFETRQV